MSAQCHLSTSASEGWREEDDSTERPMKEPCTQNSHPEPFPKDVPISQSQRSKTEDKCNSTGYEFLNRVNEGRGLQRKHYIPVYKTYHVSHRQASSSVRARK